jgi:hypothetical protein
MNPTDVIAKLSELLEKTGAAAKTFTGSAWDLLVEAQKATALAGLISAAIGLLLALTLYTLAYRMASGARKQYAKKGDMEDGSIWILMGVAGTAALFGGIDLKYVWDTLPMAIAQYRHPAAFVALEAVNRVAPAKKE